MTTKERILDLFEKNRGIYYSGEEIAHMLGISRAAVWKTVKALQIEGYAIAAVNNKGYCLSEETDILSPQGIKKYLNFDCESGYGRTDGRLELVVLQETTSTNTVVRERAVAGAREGLTVIANRQTNGRGRRGRDFYSPTDTGIYLSTLLRPQNCLTEHAVRITTMAAVAVCEAIEAVSDEKAQIKWVNDIFIKGKKVCGILTEGALGMENGLLDYAILGIGINVYPPENGFGDLNQIAGAVFNLPQADVKSKLTAEFLNRFRNYYLHMEQADYVEEYRRRSLAVGRWVNVISGNEITPAQVLGIDDECRLLVCFEDGREETLSSGEISIKLTEREINNEKQ